MAETHLAGTTRALLAIGILLTLTTGLGLWGWPDAVGRSFAWEIKAPLTAAWMGAWYVAAAAALAAGLVIGGSWQRARIALVVAGALTTTSLIATVRFIDEFRLGEGTALEQAIAWIWLAVYGALPPLVLATFLWQGRIARTLPPAPASLLPFSRAVLASIAAVATVAGLWLSAAPGALIARWPWPLNDLSAAVVGTWLLTLAIGAAWAVVERNWLRCRIVLAPTLVALVLQLVALARLENSLAGRPFATGLYAAALVAMLVALGAVGLAEERRRRTPRG